MKVVGYTLLGLNIALGWYNFQRYDGGLQVFLIFCAVVGAYYAVKTLIIEQKIEDIKRREP
jgi:hypothetical protein